MTWNCHYCDRDFRSRDAMLQHVKAIHPDKFPGWWTQ